jgi:hypothetical protein
MRTTLLLAQQPTVQGVEIATDGRFDRATMRCGGYEAKLLLAFQQGRQQVVGLAAVPG